MVALFRRYHRWLMVFVGLQFLIWSLSGLYMVLVDIHSIHGEDILSTKKPTFSANQANQSNDAIGYDINELLSNYPEAKNVTLGWLGDQVVYRFQLNGPKLIDANTGKAIEKITENLAAHIALTSLAEAREIADIELITKNPPSEIGSRALPLWRVEFVGVNSPTLYISNSTGKVLTVRQNTWRAFDLFWRLHIMDYYEGEDINNLLLNIFSVSGLLAALSGLVLLAFRLFKNDVTEAGI
ncbi:PepSY domain-containing protein [Glaciecola sp. MF2-115]|uniref:PepSY domain-containing protein n=1 Tax=Glaciecola sp. MF2-115 TaxID=3384827 RepID=UPI0039A2850C